MFSTKKFNTKCATIFGLVLLVTMIVVVPLLSSGKSHSPIYLNYLGVTNRTSASLGAAGIVVSNTTSRAVLIQVLNLLKYESGAENQPRGSYHTGSLDVGEAIVLSMPIEEEYIDWKIEVICVQQRSGPLGVLDLMREKYKVWVKGAKNAKKFDGEFSVAEKVFSTNE